MTTPHPNQPYLARQSPYASPSVPRGSRTNTLAVVSLVTAFFVSPAAIVTGHIALSQIGRTGESGRGLAVAGLILGYLGLVGAIVAFTVLSVLGAIVSAGGY